MTRWRQGESVPHHVYRQRGDEPDTRPWPDGDPPVAMFLDPDDAELAVRAMAIVAEVARDGGCDQWDEPGDQACPEFQGDPDRWCPVCRARALCRSGPDGTLVDEDESDPTVVHGSISLERDDGDGELHATCKCGVTATFIGDAADAAASAWWKQHQREAAWQAIPEWERELLASQPEPRDPVILDSHADHPLAGQVQAVWDIEGAEGVADAIRRVARGEGT